MELETDDHIYIDSLSDTDLSDSIVPLKVEIGYMFDNDITESNYNQEQNKILVLKNSQSQAQFKTIDPMLANA
jgi:hypothetical protein